MNRRQFFRSPLALLPALALPGAAAAPSLRTAGVAASAPITINIGGHLIATREFVEQELIPALREQINARDVVIIHPMSRQAAVLLEP